MRFCCLHVCVLNTSGIIHDFVGPYSINVRLLLLSRRVLKAPCRSTAPTWDLVHPPSTPHLPLAVVDSQFPRYILIKLSDIRNTQGAEKLAAWDAAVEAASGEFEHRIVRALYSAPQAPNADAFLAAQHLLVRPSPLSLSITDLACSRLAITATITRPSR